MRVHRFTTITCRGCTGMFAATFCEGAWWAPECSPQCAKIVKKRLKNRWRVAERRKVASK